MQTLRHRGGGALNAVGTVRSFMNVVKDIDFEETRERAETLPEILVVAPTELHANDTFALLFPPESSGRVDVRVWDDNDPIGSGRWDIVIVSDPDGSGLLEKVRKALGNEGRGTIFYLGDGGEGAVEALRAEITDALPVLAPALGRHFVQWRPAAVRAIIDETSKANAQFALVSNIPAVVPVLGGFVSASADLIILTKNQVMMAYRIAAAHDRNLESQMAIVRELTPVVGAGFMWRTLARQAASFVPLAAGTIPKVAIAFAGTMTIGRAADYFYQYGAKPSQSQMDMFLSTAMKLASRLPFVGKSSDEERLEDQKELATQDEQGATEKLPDSSGDV